MYIHMFSDTWKQPKSISTVWNLSSKLNWLHVKTLVVVLASSHDSTICCTFVTAKGHFLVQSVRFRVSCGWVSLLFRRGTSDRLCHWYEIAMSVQIWGFDIYYNTTSSMYEMTIYIYTYIRLDIQWNMFLFYGSCISQCGNLWTSPIFFPPGTAALPRFSFWMWPQDVPRWWVATGSGWF